MLNKFVPCLGSASVNIENRCRSNAMETWNAAKLKSRVSESCGLVDIFADGREASRDSGTRIVAVVPVEVGRA